MQMKIIIKIFLFSWCVLLLSSCELSTARLEYNRAIRAKKNQDYEVSLKYFKRVAKRKPETSLALESAIQGARLAHFDVQDYNSAIELYKFIIIYSDKLSVVYEAQFELANLYYSKTLNYKKAIIEYSKLLQLKNSTKNKIIIKTNIAKSQYHLNNFYQANVEIKELLKEDISEEKKFEILLFKGNTLVTIKKHKQAISVFKKLIIDYPDRSLKEKVFLNVSVCFEEMSDFKSAIKIIDGQKGKYPDTDFLDHKIRRLQQRRKNLPGARGLVR